MYIMLLHPATMDYASSPCAHISLLSLVSRTFIPPRTPGLKSGTHRNRGCVQIARDSLHASGHSPVRKTRTMMAAVPGSEEAECV